MATYRRSRSGLRGSRVVGQAVSENSDLALYYFPSCPFCIRVCEFLQRIGREIELRDIHREPRRREEMIAATGRETVPCLHVGDAQGPGEWIHE